MTAAAGYKDNSFMPSYDLLPLYSYNILKRLTDNQLDVPAVRLKPDGCMRTRGFFFPSPIIYWYSLTKMNGALTNLGLNSFLMRVFVFIFVFINSNSNYVGLVCLLNLCVFT